MPDADEFDSLSSSAVPGIDAPSNGEAPDPAAADVDKYKAEADAQRQAYLRTLADFENYKKRTDRYLQERSDEGRRQLLLRMLPVLDNLERAAAYREQGTPAEQLVDGLLATVRQFVNMLESEGVRPVEVKGKAFDPRVSEAIATRDDGAAPPNTVLDEARKGYMLGDDVLRPAQVVVSKPSE
jgi:molecular chaperone GrpE